VLTVAKNKSIEDALNDILNPKKLDEIVKKTVKEAGIKARKDFVNETKKVIKHYYDEYPERQYDPIGSLYHLFTYENKTRGKSIDVTINFDSARIEGMHQSNSRYHQEGDVWESIKWKNGRGPERNRQYGAVESDFIFTNFWYGDHPVTNGDKYAGFKYEPVNKGKSPEELLIEYTETYVNGELQEFVIDTFTQNLLKALK
jgi:hypothetical protein